MFDENHKKVDLKWNPNGTVTYGDVFHQNEVEMSAFNFEHANIDNLFMYFNDCEAQCQHLIASKLVLPAYEQVLKASHTFNL